MGISNLNTIIWNHLNKGSKDYKKINNKWWIKMIIKIEPIIPYSKVSKIFKVKITILISIYLKYKKMSYKIYLNKIVLSKIYLVMIEVFSNQKIGDLLYQKIL